MAVKCLGTTGIDNFFFLCVAELALVSFILPSYQENHPLCHISLAESNKQK